MTESAVDRVEVYEADDGWRWRALARNNEVIGQGEAYASKAGAIEGVHDNYGDDVRIVEQGMEAGTDAA